LRHSPWAECGGGASAVGNRGNAADNGLLPFCFCLLYYQGSHRATKSVRHRMKKLGHNNHFAVVCIAKPCTNYLFAFCSASSHPLRLCFPRQDPFLWYKTTHYYQRKSFCTTFLSRASQQKSCRTAFTCQMNSGDPTRLWGGRAREISRSKEFLRCVYHFFFGCSSPPLPITLHI